MVTAINTAAITGEYKTEFSITGPEQKESPMFGRVCGLVRERFEGLRENRDILEDSGEFEELAYQHFQIELPHSRNPDFHLRLEVKLSTKGGPVAVSVRSCFVVVDQPQELVAGPPRLALDLIRDFECYIGPDRLSALPVRLALETADEFANRIFDPARQLPILAVSENWRRQTPTNPNWLQQILTGLAEVTTYDGATANELRGRVGFQLACFNGAVRIYQPGCSRDDHREQHKFWMPSDAGALLRRPAGKVVQELVRYLPESTESREFENTRSQVRQRRMVESAAQRLALPLRQQIGELESEIETLNRRLYERERDAEFGLEKLRNLHQQLIDRDSQLDAIRNQLEQAIHREAEYEPEIARLHRQQSERDERIESLRQQLEAAISHTDSGQAEVVQLHSQLLERNSQIDSLWNELDKAARKESESDQEIARLRSQIQGSDEEVESLRQQLGVASSEAGTSRQAIEQLQENLLERESELNVLRAQLEEVLNRSEESAHLVNELTEGLKARDADIANLRILLEGIEDGTTDSDRIIAELRRELQERADDVRAINALLEDTRVRAEAAEHVATELRRELDLRPTEQAAISVFIQESQGNGAEPRTEVAAANGAVSELLLQIEVQNGEIAKLRQQIGASRSDLDNLEIARIDLEDQLKERNDEIRRLKYRLPDYLLPMDEPSYPDEPITVETVEYAVVAADQHFDKLRFLDSAFDSADDYPYQRPWEVYLAFSLLQRNAAARSEGGLGISIEDWMEKEQGNERVFSYTLHESSATMEVYGPTRYFGGYKMEEHIKIGSGTANKQHYIRIHFCWEAESSQYVIGHVGEHLPIVSS